MQAVNSYWYVNLTALMFSVTHAIIALKKVCKALIVVVISLNHLFGRVSGGIEKSRHIMQSCSRYIFYDSLVLISYSTVIDINSW